jgi:hypothetical protein
MRASERPIALLSKGLRGGKAYFMEQARLAAHIVSGLASVVETYESLKPWPRAAVSVDELCVKDGIDPVHYLKVVGHAALESRNDYTILDAAKRLDIAGRFRSNQPERTDDPGEGGNTLAYPLGRE